MTDQQPPAEQPEFQPPAGQPPAAQPGQPSYGPPAQPAQPLPYPQPGQPPYGQPPYGPPLQPPYQAPAGQQWSAPPPPPKGGRGSIWLGIGITVAVLAASAGLTFLPYNESLSSVTNLLAAGLPFALVLGGIVMAAIPRTTRTGAGVLIGIGAAILIAGGICVALLASLSVGR